MNVSAVRYRTIALGEVEMFIARRGTRAAPIVLLPNGFPTSSHEVPSMICAGDDTSRFGSMSPSTPFDNVKHGRNHLAKG
jgi:hypothetical protein